MKFLIVICIVAFTVSEACLVNRVNKTDGEEWIVKNKFVQKCTLKENGWEVKTIACQIPHGQRLNIGESVDGFDCHPKMEKVELSTKNGEKCGDHAEGSTWTESQFKKTCKNGVAVFSGCVTKDGDEIEIGGQHVSENHTFTCEKTEKGVHLGVKKNEDGPAKPHDGSFLVRKTRAVSNACKGKAEGSEWDEGSFRLTCRNKVTEFVGCYGSDKVLFPVGTVRSINKFDFKCETNNVGIRIFPVDGTPKKAAGPPGVAPPGFEEFLPKQNEAKNCQGHQNGEEWTQGHFKARCENGHIKWVACLKKSTEIPLNEERQIGDFGFTCVPSGKSIRLEPTSAVAKPVISCEGHNEGEEWRSGNFQRGCLGGKIVFKGCYKNDSFIPIGSSLTVEKSTFECSKTESGAQLRPL